MTNNQIKAALKEMQKMKNKYDTLYREFYSMKLYALDLEKEIEKLKNSVKPESSIDSMIAESKAAMKRYTAKLRKEAENYAK